MDMSMFVSVSEILLGKSRSGSSVGSESTQDFAEVTQRAKHLVEDIWATHTPSSEHKMNFCDAMLAHPIRREKIKEHHSEMGIHGPPSHPPMNFHVLLAGESGLGKTSFINNMLRYYREDGQPVTHNIDPPKTLLAHFKDPALRKTLQHSVQTTFFEGGAEKKVEIIMQDTYGYGDDSNVTNSISVVIEHIEEQHVKWRKYVTQQLMTGSEVDLLEDTRYDVCLYFISPHRFRGIDMEYLERLSEVVTILPVIAKGDSMTAAEMDLFRPTITGHSLADGDDKGSSSAAAGDITQDIERKMKLSEKFHKFPQSVHDLFMQRFGFSFPSDGLFSVISTIDEESTGIFEAAFGQKPLAWPARKYMFGSAQVFNPKHSDSFALRICLFELGFNDLIKKKKSVYKCWLTRQLEKEARVVKRQACARKLLLISTAVTALVVAAAMLIMSKEDTKQETVGQDAAKWKVGSQLQHTLDWTP